ncbi:malonate--CoA ligase [Paracoccus saliphilus]|uniref:Malonyl-CoA synthase n=1 Tax=Paracoccus saliphilus TaxID=405559 RepID=A0AA46A589_9RHOB|nr:malonyl-CoA synthase [Paracoccus saliphilus]WCR02513.1 malonyl-CoA synthase [Paracoccus saliphilus]SIS76730.1 malonyl-CoA/methylmalonyl-CoA synthetase [Paracoccus saliphilus]
MTNTLFDALMGPHEGSARDFLILGDGKRISYGEMYRLSGRLANLLQAEGVKPGDRVAVQVEKSPEALALYLATVRAGGVFLPLNTAYTPAEIAYFVGDAEPALVVCDPAREAKRADFMPADGKLMTLGADGKGSLIEAVAAHDEAHDPVAREGGDLAAILYTSGTTGRSKGAMLSHDNLLSNARTLKDAWRFTSEDVLLHALPIFHTHGLFVASNVTILSGGAMIWLPKFDAAQVVGLLPRATTMMGVPTFYTRLLDRPDFTRDLVRDMRLFTSGSAPLLAETHRAFEDRTGHRILERYGMTETNMNTSNPYEGERRAGTVGFPLPEVELRIVGEDGAELAQGEIGQIEVRGDNVFQGYWRMPEKTAEELGADGWFKTGDLGMIDADGYVAIVGRGKDLIISGGFNIYPKEVELLIDEMPGVLESAVIGVPHPDFGEGVVAVVARAKDAKPDPQAIIDGLADRLARFKQPKKVIVIDELPRNTMGKVQKAALRAEHEALFKG